MLKLIYTPCVHIILLSPDIDLKTIMMICITVCPKCYTSDGVLPSTLTLAH